MSIIASVWRAYRRRRLRTQVLIAGLVVLLGAAATGEEAPAGPTDLVIERPSTTTTTSTSSTPSSEVTPPPRTSESTSVPSTTTSTIVRVESTMSGEFVSVTKHVDGDTLWVSGSEKVRFIGMDTPETTNGRRDCFGAEASARTAELLPLGTEVRLEYDAGRHPSYSGTCIPPDVSDADCAGGRGNGPHYVQEKDVQVVGSDPYELDSDGDGVGCES